MKLEYENRAVTDTAPFTKKRRGAVGIIEDGGWGPSGITKFLDADSLYGCPLYKNKFVMAVSDILSSAASVYVFRPSGGISASCVLGYARYAGSSGNRITLSVTAKSGDLDTVYDVKTIADGDIYDCQAVRSMAEICDNELVIFDREAEIFPTAGLPFTGGCDATLTDGDYISALSVFDGISLDVLVSNETADARRSAFGDHIRKRRGMGDHLYGISSFECGGGVLPILCADTSADAVYYISGLYASLGAFESISGKLYKGSFPVLGYESEASAAKVKERGIVLYRSRENTVICGGMYSEPKERLLDRTGRLIREIYESRFYGKVSADTVGCAKLKAELLRELGELVSDISVLSDGKSITVTVATAPLSRVFGIDIGISL